MIISEKPHTIAAAIDSQIERGIALIKAQGFYSKNDFDMVYSVIYKSQLQELKDLIREIDPHAFITITDANEGLGEGFTHDQNKQPIQKY
nr:YitT family protein [Streptococcus sp. X13SY08]